MSIQTIATLAIVVAIPVAGQVERAPRAAPGAMALAAPGACSLSLQGDQPILATTIAVTGGTDVTVTASPGRMPSVSAMAINTKGTGASNGRSAAPAGQSCAARPSPGPTLTGAMRASPPAATCAMSADGGSASVSVPLSSFGASAAKEFKGHVTLLKRGGDTVAALTRDGWSAPVVVASCSASGLKTGYDLAVAKKV